MTASTIRRRVARTRHTCTSSEWPHPIRPGEVYLERTEFPGDDLGYADAAGHPVRHAQCAECAQGSGRGHLLAEGGDRQ